MTICTKKAMYGTRPPPKHSQKPDMKDILLLGFAAMWPVLCSFQNPGKEISTQWSQNISTATALQLIGLSIADM